MQAEQILSRGLTRRQSLPLVMVFPGAFLAAACGSPPKIRRSEGIWKQEEVERLAKAMLEEPQYNDIAYAGQTLLDNQQGRLVLGKESHGLVQDGQLQFSTAKNLPGPLRTYIVYDRPLTIMDIPSRNLGEPPLHLQAPTVIRAPSINLGNNFMGSMSDLMFKFSVAKEMFNFQAMDLVASYAFQLSNERYNLPQDEVNSQRIRRALISSGVIGDVDAGKLADNIAHFYIVPNYLLAKDQNRFTSNDMQYLGLFEDLANEFTNAGVLQKTNDTYAWTGDYQSEWFRLGLM